MKANEIILIHERIINNLIGDEVNGASPVECSAYVFGHRVGSAHNSIAKLAALCKERLSENVREEFYSIILDLEMAIEDIADMIDDFFSEFEDENEEDDE